LARLGSASHPSSHLIIFLLCMACNRPRQSAPTSTAAALRQQRGPGPRAPASCRCPSAGPLAAWRRQQRCCSAAATAVLLAILPRLPLGLHVALDLSLVDLQRWPLFGHSPHAEGMEAPLPVRPVGLRHFRLFPNGLLAADRVFRLRITLTFGLLSTHSIKPYGRNRNSDALGRELREAPLTRLWGHFLAATHRGPLSTPFTTRVAEGISACSMVFHGSFLPILLEKCARPIGLGNRPFCLLL
jgi:hypothetical protein